MKKNTAKIFYSLVLGFFAIILFQNCSQTRFAADNSTALESMEGGVDSGLNETSRDPEMGLSGGHLDLDTSSIAYEFNAGKTDHHVHEYDDKFNVKQIDFFNLIDTKFTNIVDRVVANQTFYIIVANSKLSPGAILEINGVGVGVVDHQNKVDQYLAGNVGALKKYSLADLQSFKLKFTSDNLGDGILVPTQTSCVVSNKPSIRNEYRNGALVVQIIDAQKMALSPTTRTALIDGGLLWEASVFWHKDGTPCQ